jgi:hypothetical protein
MPKGWKTKGDEWRLTYVKKECKKSGDEHIENFSEIIRLLTPKEETIGGVTFKS